MPLHGAAARFARLGDLWPLPMVAGWVVAEDAGKQQIPFGNDKQKNKSNSNSRFPAGMTTRKAKARATTEARAVVWLTTDC